MGRTFAIERDEAGWEVVDDRGTAWASFAHDNPNGAFLSEFMLSLAREAYALGARDAGSGRPGALALHRGRDGGLRTWDVRLGGPSGDCVARDGRHPAQLRPPRRARLMLALARCLYDVAATDALGGDAGASLADRPDVPDHGPDGAGSSVPGSAEAAGAGLR